MNPPSKYKAFISYKHSEVGRLHAVALEKGLKRYAKPALKLPIKIFRDEKHMVPDNDLSALITKGLGQSEYLIFIAERGAADSTWCQEELEYWCGELNRKDRLIIIHVDDSIVLDIGNKKIDWEKTNALPSLLKKYIPFIPFYVDLHWAKNKDELVLEHGQYKSVINLVSAKLRGVAPEELNDEELKVYRRNVRLRNWAIGVLSILLLVSVFASVFALRKQNEAFESAEEAKLSARIAQDSTIAAQIQRMLAMKARGDAERQRDTAQLERNNALIAQREAEEQRDTAELERKRAIRQANISEARRLSFLSIERGVDKSFTEALLLAYKAYETVNSPRPEIIYRAFYSLFANQSESGIILNTGALEEFVEQVWYIVFAPDSQSFIIPLDNQVNLFDLKGRLLADIREITSPGGIFIPQPKPYQFEELSVLQSATFSPDSRYILTTSKYGTVRLWDVKGKLMTEFIGHNNMINSASFSPDGQYILTASQDGHALVWDLEGKLLADLDKHEGPVRMAVFSPNGRYILTASHDGTAGLWSLQGNLMHRLEGHISWVTTATFSHDNRHILTSSMDGTAKVWDLEGNLEGTLEGNLDADLEQRGYWGCDAIFSLDGRKILTSTLDPRDPVPRIWDVKGVLLAELKGHQEQINWTAFSPDGNRVLTSSIDGTAKVWDLKGKMLADLIDHAEAVYSVVFSPDGKHILTASADNTAKLWDLNGNLLGTMIRHTASVNHAQFSPDGNTILTSSSDKTVRQWQVTSIPYMKLSENIQVRHAALSPDGESILTTTEDGRAILWDRTGKAKDTLNSSGGMIRSAVFSPLGSNILTTSENGTAVLWNTDGQLKIKFPGSSQSGDIAVFSPDGQSVVTVSPDNVKRWNLKGRLLAQSNWSPGLFQSVGFTPEGDDFFVASHTLVFYDSSLNFSHWGWMDNPQSASYSSDGRMVIILMKDGSTQLMDKDFRELPNPLKGYSGQVVSAVFSKDNSTLR